MIMSTSFATQIYAVGTAYPPYVMRQAEVQAQAARIFGEEPDYFRRMASAYGNAGVETRHSCVPLDWYLESHGWPERTQLYEENATTLLQDAGQSCLNQAGVESSNVAATVVVSSTGVVTPSLDVLIQEPLGLLPNTQRLPIFGLGCAGGVIGLSRAAAVSQSLPDQWVLFLCVELCGLTFRSSDLSKANFIGTAIFGDGAAAVLIRTASSSLDSGVEPKAELQGWAEHTWPNTRDVMGWRVEDDGLGVVFSRTIPNLVSQKLRPVTDHFLSKYDLDLSGLAGVLCHPGGDKVLSALEHAFDLDPQALQHARAILKAYGNMSAVTVLAVLKRALDSQDRGRHMMTALGPGFTAAFALLNLY